MRKDSNADPRGFIIALLVGSSLLLVFAGARLLEDQINDALNVMSKTLGVTKGEISNVVELLGNILGWGIIILANLLWLPGFIVPPWALIAVAGLCALAAGYLWLRLRASGGSAR